MEKTANGRRRGRATAACTSCRKSRIRCIRHGDQKDCSGCQNSGLECIFDDKDGRKNRIPSKSLLDGLYQRIDHLEALLKKQSNHNVNGTAQSCVRLGNVSNVPSPLSSLEDELPAFKDVLADPGEGGAEDTTQPGEFSQKRSNSTGVRSYIESAQNKKLLRKLVPCSVRFDMASGRVRFFGPTTSMHILSGARYSRSLERRESHWPIATILRGLPPETHDYLMQLYWTCHNSVCHLVHKDAFYDDLERGATQFYSIFVHLCMLAMGFRYADKGRHDIQRLAQTGPASSTLHEKARSMAKQELDSPGGLPSIQALVLLGDLECSIGQDDTGWMYAGMSFRLVFDVGLHVDPSDLQLTEREAQIRHMVLWACILHDRYWALYLGRPTTLKTSDMVSCCLSKDFGPLISCRPSGHEKQPDTRVYEALLRLMELVEPLCTFGIASPANTTDAYFKIIAVDRDLNDWLAGISDDLTWTPENVLQKPASFFLLHAQYHSAMILLHRPFVPCRQLQEDRTWGAAKSDRLDHFTLLSRTLCAEHAKQVTSIFAQYRSRFDLSQAYVTGLQHAGTAATALMAEATVQSDAKESKELLDCLVSVNETIRLMSKSHQPAVLMSRVLDRFIEDFQVNSSTEEGVSDGLDKRTNSPCQRSLEMEGSLAEGGKRSYEVYNQNARDIPASNKAARSESTRSEVSPPNPLPFFPTSWLDDLNSEEMEFFSQGGLDSFQNSTGQFPGNSPSELGDIQFD